MILLNDLFPGECSHSYLCCLICKWYSLLGMEIPWFLHVHFLPLVSCLLEFEKCLSNLCASHTATKKRLYIQCKSLDLLLCCIENTGVQQGITWGFNPFYHYAAEKTRFLSFWKNQTLQPLDKYMQWASMHFEAWKKIQETTVEGKKKTQKQLRYLK